MNKGVIVCLGINGLWAPHNQMISTWNSFLYLLMLCTYMTYSSSGISMDGLTPFATFWWHSLFVFAHSLHLTLNLHVTFYVSVIMVKILNTKSYCGEYKSSPTLASLACKDIIDIIHASIFNYMLAYHFRLFMSYFLSCSSQWYTWSTSLFSNMLLIHIITCA